MARVFFEQLIPWIWRGEWAPLDRLADTVGARLGERGVTMPEGFAVAYRAYVAGGWGTIGPRQLGVDAEKGKIVAGTKRTFLTGMPANSDEVKIAIRPSGTFEFPPGSPGK